LVSGVEQLSGEDPGLSGGEPHPRLLWPPVTQLELDGRLHPVAEPIQHRLLDGHQFPRSAAPVSQTPVAVAAHLG
jgi:hypothetical protein